jgi:hypothetical protein
MTLKRLVILFCFSVPCLAMPGCGGGGDPRHKDLVPASGTVFYKGDAVEGATIIFHHDDASQQGGSTISEAGGKFALRTFSGLGALPGNYKVTVAKDEVLNPLSPEETERLEREGKDIPPTQVKSLLPQKYRGKASTPLDITIPAGGNKDIKLELAD